MTKKDNKNQIIEEFNEFNPKYIENLSEFLRKLPSDFSLSLKEVVERTTMTMENTAISAHISFDTLKGWKSGTIKPTKENLVRLCLGLRLPYDISLHLLRYSGLCQTNDLDDVAYRKILQICCSFEEANKQLKGYGFKSFL